MTQSGTQSSKVFQSNRFMHSIDWVLLLNKEFQLATYILREADPKPVCLSYSKHVCSSACPSVRPLVRPFVTKAFSQDYLKGRNFCGRNFCGRNFLRKKFFAEEILRKKFLRFSTPKKVLFCGIFLRLRAFPYILRN